MVAMKLYFFLGYSGLDDVSTTLTFMVVYLFFNPFGLSLPFWATYTATDIWLVWVNKWHEVE